MPETRQEEAGRRRAKKPVAAPKDKEYFSEEEVVTEAEGMAGPGGGDGIKNLV